jgi:hypothetical protein|nr:hypothetical protein Q903MT_gene260 [Picea sitchensis]
MLEIMKRGILGFLIGFRNSFSQRSDGAPINYSTYACHRNSVKLGIAKLMVYIRDRGVKHWGM